MWAGPVEPQADFLPLQREIVYAVSTLPCATEMADMIHRHRPLPPDPHFWAADPE